MQGAKEEEFDPNVPDCTEGDFYCKICDASMNSEDMWSSHIAGKKHIKKVRSGPRVIYKRKIEDESDDYDLPPKFPRYDDDSNSYGGWPTTDSHITDPEDVYNDRQKQRDGSYIRDARDPVYKEEEKRNFPNQPKKSLLDTPNTRPSSSNPQDSDDSRNPLFNEEKRRKFPSQSKKPLLDTPDSDAPFERRKDTDAYDLKFGAVKDYGHKSADLSPKSKDKELYERRNEKDINPSSRLRLPETPDYLDERKIGFSNSLKPSAIPPLKLPPQIAAIIAPPAIPPLTPPPKIPSILASPAIPPLKPPPTLPPLQPPPGLPPLKPSPLPEMADKYMNSQHLFEDAISQMFQSNSSAHEKPFSNEKYGKLNDNFRWQSHLPPKDNPDDFFSNLSTSVPIIEKPNLSAISFTTQMIQSLLSGMTEDQLCSSKPVSNVNVDQPKVKSTSEAIFEKFANQLSNLKQPVANQKPVVNNAKNDNKGYDFMDILNRYNEDSLFDDIYGPEIDEEKSNSSSMPSSSEKIYSEKVCPKRVSLEKVDSKLKTIDPDNLTHDVLDDLLNAYLPKSERSKSEISKTERSKPERSASERSTSDMLKFERSKSERSKTERSKMERSTSERSTSERSTSETLKFERSKTERSKPERSASERSTSERSTSERSTSERVKSERLKSERLKSERPKSEIVRKEQRDSPEEIAQKVESLPTKSFLQIVLKKVEKIELKDWDEVNILSNIIVKAQAAVCSKLPLHLQSAIKQKMSRSTGKKIPSIYENPANSLNSTLPPQEETPVNQPTYIVPDKPVASTSSSPDSVKNAETSDKPIDNKSVYRQILLSLYRKAFSSSSSATNSSTTVTQSQSPAIPQTVSCNHLKSSLLLNYVSNLEDSRNQPQSSERLSSGVSSRRLLANQNVSGLPSKQSISSSSQNILSKSNHSSNKVQMQPEQPSSRSTAKEWGHFFAK